MKVIFRTRHVALTPTLEAHARKHLVERITRFFDSAAAQLVIELGDVNGPKGGDDKECHLTFFLPNARILHVEELDHDAYTAFDHAGDRLIRRIKRELQRMRRPGAHAPMHNPLGRSAAAFERQIESYEAGTSSPPHISPRAPNKLPGVR